MLLANFGPAATGRLVEISGSDPRLGSWRHAAFVPDDLPELTPTLTTGTFNAVSRARAALAALDSSARRLPNPALLRQPTLRREAQSTSALEGTFAPLSDVLAADEESEPADINLREVLNYVRAAEQAFAWHADGRPLTVGLLADLHRVLMRGTAGPEAQVGRVRSIQVVIGTHGGVRVEDARFVPAPPGADLERGVADCVTWISRTHEDIDPVVAAAMAHYQFETLHPFSDGNGRLGRLLVVLQLLTDGVLTEPTLTVSPWFEARRADYYDGLLGVSQSGGWDTWVRFFADGLTSSAQATERQLLDLLEVAAALKAKVRTAGLRADTAMSLVDFALAQPIFSVRQVQRRLRVTYARANGLVRQMVAAGVLEQYDEAVYDRRFAAPDVLHVLLRA